MCLDSSAENSVSFAQGTSHGIAPSPVAQCVSPRFLSTLLKHAHVANLGGQ